jgi:hypothetical protein
MYEGSDSHFPAFETPRRILYNRIRDYFIKTRLAIVVDEYWEGDGTIYIVNEKAEMILDKREDLNDRIYICRSIGKIEEVVLVKKKIGNLINEITEFFK